MPVNKRTLIWAGTAVVALAVAGTITAVTVANAEAEETARQCTVATERGSEVAGTFVRSTLDADDALAAVEVLELPGDEAWSSTAFADKPATDDRLSGTELIANVTDAKAAAYAIVVPEDCAVREDAAAIHEAADDLDASLAELDEHVGALATDFAAFQEDERARVAAEVEAARIAAEQEAARLAAEEAERQRAAEEAARQTSRSSSNSGSSGNTGGSNGSSGGSKPSGPPPGGQIGDGTNGGAPVCDNGMGGTRPC